MHRGTSFTHFPLTYSLPVSEHPGLVHFSVGGQLDCFQLVAFMNHPAGVLSVL